uniref:Rho guanine nucleotide exchange factor 1 (Trinotate prediction) n=1 Tax=Henneguya salminicola TaxID=69463 RepID=A0A6G3MF42_HENSL
MKIKVFVSNAEAVPEMRKMGILDLFQTIHKHLAEYPMYIGRYIENTLPSDEFRQKLSDTAEGCKNLLNEVNEAIKKVQDDQIHSKYSCIIEKCIKSEKYSSYFPPNIDFQAERIMANFVVTLKCKKEKKIYILLSTNRYIFLLNKKEDKYKLRPIEMIPIETNKKVMQNNDLDSYYGDCY